MKTYEPYRQRVLDEREQLADKFGKLCTFLNSEAYSKVEKLERDRLYLQSTIMDSYLKVLDMRIEAWK